MKQAILSMQRIVNYGSVLQAWSLREMIRQATGEDASFLDIQDEPVLNSARSIRTRGDYAAEAAMSRSVFQRGRRWVISRLSAYNKRLIKAFMRDELRLEDQNDGPFDHVIVGSDEVFNHAKGVRLQLHGEIPQAGHIISYAASCGSASVADVAPGDLPRLRQAMSGFDAISVRDSGTEAYVRQLWDGTVHRHLDPVLMGPLHARKPRKVWLNKYLLVYAYGQRIRTAEEINAIRDFAKKRKLIIVAMGGSQFWCDLYVPASPMRMLDWFTHADYVVTDTFHGTIFSVISHCRFAVLLRPSNANKLASLLEDLGLTEQRVRQMEMLPSILEREIDYLAVDERLAKERVRAKEYLKEQLRNA